MRSSRSLHVVLGTLIATSLLLSASPALAGIPAGRYAIGDSVMLGARDDLIARGFRVNAQISRQFRDVAPLVRELAAGGHLPVNVIVHLGTNGLINGADCDGLVRMAGPERRIFLVTVKVPRSYRDPNNARLRACAHRHDNVSIIDWYGLSRYHTGWFYSDGYHLRPVGRNAYAALLDRSV